MSHIQRIRLKTGAIAHRVFWSHHGVRRSQYFSPLVPFANIRQFARNIDSDIANELFKRPSTVKLSALIEQYKVRRQAEHDSWREAIAMRHLIDYLGDVYAHQVTADRLHEFRDALLEIRLQDGEDFASDQKRRRGVNHDLRHIRVVFRWAYRRGIIESHPFEKVELYKVSRPSPDVLTREEMRRMQLALAKPDRLIFHLLRFSGLRIGEACALRVSDIDVAGGVIRLSRTKNRDQVSIPLDQRLARICRLTKWLHRDPSAPLIPHKPETVTHYFRAAMKRAGINKAMPTHIFRHTAGRRIIERYFTTGNAQGIAKKFLRHKTDVMTDHYTQVYLDDVDKAMKDVDL